MFSYPNFAMRSPQSEPEVFLRLLRFSWACAVQQDTAVCSQHHGTVLRLLQRDSADEGCEFTSVFFWRCTLTRRRRFLSLAPRALQVPRAAGLGPASRGFEQGVTKMCCDPRATNRLLPHPPLYPDYVRLRRPLPLPPYRLLPDSPSSLSTPLDHPL